MQTQNEALNHLVFVVRFFISVIATQVDLLPKDLNPQGSNSREFDSHWCVSGVTETMT